MGLPTKNIGFISNMKDKDFIATRDKALSFHMNYLAIRVLLGAKQMNVLSIGNKDIVESMIKQCEPKGLHILAYVTITGGDVQAEFNKLVVRIDRYIGKGLHGLVIEVTNGWSQRLPAEALKYIRLVRAKYPNLSISLLDTTTGSVNMQQWAELVDQIMPLCTWTADPYAAIHEEYVRYLNYGVFSNEAELDSRFVPVIGICNLPAHAYIFKSGKVQQAYEKVMESNFNACGFWDWTPAGVAGLGDDGSSIDQTMRLLLWDKVSVPPVVIPPIIVPPIIVPPDLTYTDARWMAMFGEFKERTGYNA